MRSEGWRSWTVRNEGVGKAPLAFLGITAAQGLQTRALAKNLGVFSRLLPISSGATHKSPKWIAALKVTLNVFTLTTAKLCSKLSSPKKLLWPPCNAMNFCKSMSIHLDPAVEQHSLENTI